MRGGHAAHVPEELRLKKNELNRAAVGHLLGSDVADRHVRRIARRHRSVCATYPAPKIATWTNRK